MTEKKINICGKEVCMIYCTATENNYEEMSGGKSISVFVPTFKKDNAGNDIIDEPAKATIGDYVTLALAAIVAYYSKKKEEMPISAEDVLFETTPSERNDLLSSIVELRNEWYSVPKIVEETIKKETDGQKAEDPKNA